LLNNPSIKERGIYKAILILPWALPATVAILSWQGLLNGSYGAINNLFININLISEPIPWLTDPMWARFALIMVNIWLGFPYMMNVCLGSLAAIPDSYYDSLKSLKYVRVTIEKDNTSFNAAVELLEKDGCHVAKLRTNRFMERYLNDRYLKLEFSLNSANGLKIPVSSMLEKEYYVLPSELITTDKDKKSTITKQVLDQDTISEKKVSIGTYYIVDSKYYVDSSIVKGGDILKNPSTGQDYIVSSKENLYGVYCTNQGYCQFKPVDVLYKNKEYAIVSTDTQGGLSAYDHIIVDPSTIHENDFIN
ncbi:MAG: carbohydrate ABC transporter permease, partial [Eubacterium sp.]